MPTMTAGTKRPPNHPHQSGSVLTLNDATGLYADAVNGGRQATREGTVTLTPTTLAGMLTTQPGGP